MSDQLTDEALEAARQACAGHDDYWDAGTLDERIARYIPHGMGDSVADRLIVDLVRERREMKRAMWQVVERRNEQAMYEAMK